jgi:hypothetical protein
MQPEKSMVVTGELLHVHLNPNGIKIMFRDILGPATKPEEWGALRAEIHARILEPWNDTCNPMIEPVFRCFEKARFVFQLCGVPENLQILCHGDGHDTRRNMRNYAYAWMEEKLMPTRQA